MELADSKILLLNVYLLQEHLFQAAVRPVTEYHSWKDCGTRRSHSELMGGPGTTPSKRKGMKRHREGGGWLYPGALNFWVPDKQLTLGSSASTLLKDTQSLLLGRKPKPALEVSNHTITWAPLWAQHLSCWPLVPLTPPMQPPWFL